MTGYFRQRDNHLLKNRSSTFTDLRHGATVGRDRMPAPAAIGGESTHPPRANEDPAVICVSVSRTGSLARAGRMCWVSCALQKSGLLRG